jgi:hypothetical protein
MKERIWKIILKLYRRQVNRKSDVKSRKGRSVLHVKSSKNVSVDGKVAEGA